MNPSTNLLSLSKNLKNKSLFTDAEWDVVTYIDEHQAEVPQMNIGVLKEKTYVSNGTIIRICRKLGYDGFKALKLALARNVEFQKYIHYDVDINQPFKKDDPTHTIIHDITSLYQTALDEIQPLLDPDALNKAAELLMKANRIFIFMRLGIRRKRAKVLIINSLRSINFRSLRLSIMRKNTFLIAWKRMIQ